MTSPNFLSHIGSQGFIQQPGIGDILGQQFQNLAQTRGVVREQNQRQQQIDQLGQYYQGQVNEMQRLRDRQEQEAQYARQRAVQRQAILSRHPPAPNETPEQAVQRLKLMLPDLVQIGDESVPSIVELLKSIQPDKQGPPIQRDVTKELRDSTGMNVISPAQPVPDTGKRVERTADLGDKVHVWYTDGTEGEMPKGRIPGAGGTGEGGITPYQGMQEDSRLRGEFRTETREIDKALLNNRKIDETVVKAAAEQNSLPAQYQVMVSFIQALDNSVVREGEVALYRSSEPLLQRANNFLAKYAEGKAQLVNPASIRQMAQLTKRAQEKLTAARTRIKNHYINQAKRAGRQNPEELFREDDGGDGAGGGGNASNIDKLLSGKKP